MAIANDIPGTYVFDGTLALKGYALNKMCYSFNEAANRAAFLELLKHILENVSARMSASSGSTNSGSGSSSA